ncbi:MAG: RluA family pseudouridine synthase [Bacteroidota bacterium]
MPEAPKRFPGRIGDWVIANNHQFIVFNKPAGLAVQSSRKDQLSLRQMGSAFCRTDLKTIHRLDQPVSGLVMYGKKDKATSKLSELFKSRKIKKTYLAVIALGDLPEEKVLEHHLLVREGKPTQVAKDDTEGLPKAKLSYKIIARGDRYQVLEIEPETGYKHQIRAQLAAIGFPIRGDRKYGFKRANEGGAVDLHAWKLEFAHPVSGEMVKLEADLPKDKIWEIIK